jgi:tRNA pseudouridine55 synthase
MHGVINFLKPPGMTSHDAVAFVRRVAGTKRVGHTGTLDPAAAGVLPICIGQATRLVEYLQEGTKEYIAEASFGYETDTLDAMGEVVAEGDASAVALETLRVVLDPFRGAIQQTPPLYSAIKQGGKKLYELARAGVEESTVEIESREVTISKLHVTRFVAGDASTRSAPRAMLHIECSGGTYIRSLVRDIGRTLGCGATMTFLVRTRNGSFSINEASTPEEIQRDWPAPMLPMTDVLGWCAREVIIDEIAVAALAQGRVVESANLVGAWINEYKQDATQAKQRRTNAMHNSRETERVLFFNSNRTIAALAVPLDQATQYKPDKVFFLDSDD